MKAVFFTKISFYSLRKILSITVILLATSVFCQAQNSHDIELSGSIGGAGVAQARAQEEDGQPFIVPQNESQTGAQHKATAVPEAVSVNKVEVTTDNAVLGGIEANNGGQVFMGDSKLTKVNAESVAIDTKNKITGKIEAHDNSAFKAGTVQLENHQGQSVRILSDNTLNGKVTTKQKSIVSIGNTNSGAAVDPPRRIFPPGPGSGLPKPIIPPVPPVQPPIPAPDDNDQCTIKRKTGETSETCSDLCRNGDVCSEDCFIESGCNIIDGCSIPPGLKWWFVYRDIFGGEELCCSPSTHKPCNNHDICYQTCGSDKTSCDSALFTEMVNYCKKLPGLMQDSCFKESIEIYLGVRTVYGDQAFWERQLLACHGVKTP